MLRPEEKRLVFGRIAYAPSPEQWAVHEDTSLVRLVAGGERAGKSRLAGAEVTAHAADGDLFWLLGKDYGAARGEFSHIADDFTRLDAIERGGLSQPDEGRWTMHLKGGIEITTVSADDPLKIATKAPAGIVLCEAGQHEYTTFLRAYARTAEGRARGEGWLLLAGTFEKSRAWYRELYNRGQGINEFGLRSHSLPTWSNRAVFPGGRQDPAVLAMETGLPPDVFLERFAGIPAAREGTVFPEFQHTAHVMPLGFGPVETALRSAEGWVLPETEPLEVWVDPGYAGGYAVLFVCIVGGLAFVVDEIFAKGKTGERIILEAQAKRSLWQRVTGGVMDIAGSQHHAMASQWELWQKLAGINLRMNRVPIADGIARHRTFLVDPYTMQPRIFFDPKCENAIWEHTDGYRYPDTSPNRDSRELPIDRDNHACKAIAYGLVARFGYVDGERIEAKAKPPESEIERLMREEREEQTWQDLHSDAYDAAWLD